MAVWAIADLHLSFGVENKKMDIFGAQWKDHAAKIEKNWLREIHKEDLVLIAGDISWAMKLEEAIVDLQWIDRLPGIKVILRGNHDYWWGSLSKIQKILPPSIHAIHNNAFFWNDIAIGGSRLWDTEEYHFNDIVEFRENKAAAPKERSGTGKKEEDEKIFQRELTRLEMSLKQLDQRAKTRIAMTHYPPIGLDLADSRASTILENYHIDICVFGHLHSILPKRAPFGVKEGVRYVLTSCDYLDFKPLRIL